MFKVNASGFISRGVILNIAIAAKYPEAPPCPTDEYNVAATKIKAARVTTFSNPTYLPLYKPNINEALLLLT